MTALGLDEMAGSFKRCLRSTDILYQCFYTCKLRFFRHIMIKTLLLVGTGGFLGSISRFLASRFVQENLPFAFPFGTFFVNIYRLFSDRTHIWYF